MGTRTWMLVSLPCAMAALSLAGPSFAREGVKTIPLAAVSAVDDRNVASVRPVEPIRPAVPIARDELSVAVNRAKVIKLPEKAQTVVIGNPGVADIAIQKNGVVVLTGKSFGVTNFIALDSSGSIIGESMVSVTAPTDSTVTVQRGLERQTYSCTPVCQPSVALGDAGGFFAETKGQVEQNSAFVGTR